MSGNGHFPPSFLNWASFSATRLRGHQTLGQMYALRSLADVVLPKSTIAPLCDPGNSRSILLSSSRFTTTGCRMLLWPQSVA